jgi:hypothetical protein
LRKPTLLSTARCAFDHRFCTVGDQNFAAGTDHFGGQQANVAEATSNLQHAIAGRKLDRFNEPICDRCAGGRDRRGARFPARRRSLPAVALGSS